MYVCLCHGFTDSKVRTSAQSVECADGTLSDFYRVLGVRPTCGKCVPMVLDIVRTVSSQGLTCESTPA